MTQTEMLNAEIEYLERGIAQMEQNNGTDYVIDAYKEQLELLKKGAEFFNTFTEASARANELNRSAKETGKYFGFFRNRNRNWVVVEVSK
jgi:hypothetical protein